MPPSEYCPQRLANPNDRSVVLDVLRAVAVLLVLGRHLEPCPLETSAFLHRLTSVWAQGGWMGVDLFFVLSGFLVSGLLFREHQLHAEVRVKRFFFRRGLKIYPAFAAFLAIACTWRHLAGGQIGPRRLLVEVAFLQNYLPSVWFHTWSLAVEEHFYLLLPLILIPVFKKRGRDPVPTLLVIFSLVATSCLCFRIFDSSNTYEFYRHTAPTHKRIDSLFAGVMLSALYYYRRDRLQWFAQKYRAGMLLAGTLCVGIPFVFPLETSPFVYGIGYTTIYGGAALVLAVAVTSQALTHWFWRRLASIGMDSYSIYLWHAVALMLVAEPLRRMFPQIINWYIFATIYIGCSIGIGIAMSKLVEWPVLQLRDRYFPSRSKSAGAGTSGISGEHQGVISELSNVR